MKILILSPHRGTAAFSLALAITRWRAGGHRVTILNVFSRSLHAPWSDADTVHENDRLSYVSALRRKEDESFLRQIPGLAMIDLNLKDAPIRLRCDPATVFALEPSPEDTAIPKIHKALDQNTFDALVLPLALGNHVDHRVVREATLLASTQHPCAFYEDLPYATSSEADSAALPGKLTPVLIHGTHAQPAEFKRRMAVLYASQLDGEEARAIAAFSERYQGAERLWANAAWLASPGLNPL
ncbi:PIG-L family deacetylase [Granulicella sp. WH15]|uniref:PIG-L deacetylase family protein n=1 Tax=Granulicella sp. WH15 TaxID=2602070 RepID=UPI0013A59DEF|nr:PIG-L family deacetylase [Granulicella sp. WH15]